MAKKLNQKDRVLRHLETYGSIDPRQAYFDYSIMRLAAVIFNLKEEGHDIKSESEEKQSSLLGDLFESFTKIYK